MKGIVFVALFAFVAVQLCHSAPTPDEEKKEEAPVSPAAVESSPAPQEATEVKAAEPPAPAPPAAAAEPVAKAEEKKA